jgi:hypothetical protein
MLVRSALDYDGIVNRLNNRTEYNLVFVGVKIWQKSPQKKPPSRPTAKKPTKRKSAAQKAEELAQAEKELAIAQG